MPVFTEYSTSSRELRVLPSFAPPLPRRTAEFKPGGDGEKYEVVISGVSLPYTAASVAVDWLTICGAILGRARWAYSRIAPRTIRTDR